MDRDRPCAEQSGGCGCSDENLERRSCAFSTPEGYLSNGFSRSMTGRVRTKCGSRSGFIGGRKESSFARRTLRRRITSADRSSGHQSIRRACETRSRFGALDLARTNERAAVTGRGRGDSQRGSSPAARFRRRGRNRVVRSRRLLLRLLESSRARSK